MKYFSMFSGIGGFEYGIERAIANIGDKRSNTESGPTEPAVQFGGKRNSDENGRSLLSADIGERRAVCIGYSEINKYAIQIYRKHFPEHKNYGDAARIIPEQLPDFDLLVGGFPCQAFSIAGKRRGFEDTRGTLFFEIARIAKYKRPKYLLLENVAGLLSHEKGITFEIILATLDELGYDAQWEVLNSKNFGVPQNRERVFIVGCLRGSGGREIFPLGQNDQLSDGKIGTDKRQPQAKYSTALRSTGNMKADATFVEEKSIGVIDRGKLRETEIALGIQESYRKGHDNHGARPMLKEIGNIYSDKPNFKSGKSGYAAGRVYDPNGIGASVTALGGGMGAKTGLYAVGENTRIRRLTPIECERLQAYPDGWTEFGIDDNGKEVKISDSQRYKVLGNSVTTSVITAIIERIYDNP